MKLYVSVKSLSALPAGSPGQSNEQAPSGPAQHLLAWEVLFHALEQVSGEQEIDASQFSAGPTGKPVWDRHPELSFNLSHCKEAVAVAVCDGEGRQVGIDVERRFPWKESLARRVAHPGEWMQLLSLAPSERETALQVIWSLKESYLKCTGEGLRRDPASLDLWRPQRVDDTLRLFAPAGTWRDGTGPVSFLALQTDRYTLAVCAPQEAEDALTFCAEPDPAMS